jgi:dihydrolipoamide dehydrogenase
MVLPEVPRSMVVIGAGAIGIEFADFWNAFGIEVTVVEAMPRILPIEDEEVSQALTRALKKKGMAIHANSKVESVKVSGKTVTTTFAGPDGKSTSVTSDRLLMAVGVRANTESMGLEGMGVTLDRGFIRSTTTTAPPAPASGPSATSPAPPPWPTWPWPRPSPASRRWPASTRTA